MSGSIFREEDTCVKRIFFEFWWEIGYFGEFMKGLKCIKKKLNFLFGKKFILRASSKPRGKKWECTSDAFSFLLLFLCLCTTFRVPSFVSMCNVKNKMLHCATRGWQTTSPMSKQRTI